MVKKIAPDKWRHFFAGILVGLILQVLLPLIFTSLFTASLIVFLMVIVISYGFELFSLVSGLGHYDFMDAVASVLGGLVGMGLVLIFQIGYYTKLIN